MTVRAIRGATTVENNISQDILNETKILIDSICEKNNLIKDDIISIIFSVTKDLNTAFPAAAARQLGFNDIALMCTNEIEVPESLKRCIRVLMHFNTEKTNSELIHVYLNQAKSLRPDLIK